jgi:hypothetical protein
VGIESSNLTRALYGEERTRPLLRGIIQSGDARLDGRAVNARLDIRQIDPALAIGA